MIPGQVIIGEYEVTHPIDISHSQSEITIECLAHIDNCDPISEIKAFEKYLANDSATDTDLAGGLVPQANTIYFLQLSDGNKIYYGYIIDIDYKLDENSERFIEYTIKFLKYKEPNQPMGLYALPDGDEITFEDGWEEGFENWKVCDASGQGIYGSGYGGSSGEQNSGVGVTGSGTNCFDIFKDNQNLYAEAAALMMKYKDMPVSQGTIRDYVMQKVGMAELIPGVYSNLQSCDIPSSNAEDTYLAEEDYSNLEIYVDNLAPCGTYQTNTPPPACPICGRVHGCLYDGIKHFVYTPWHNSEIVINHPKTIKTAVIYLVYQSYYGNRTVNGKILDFPFMVNGKRFNIPWKGGAVVHAVICEINSKHLWFTSSPKDETQIPGIVKVGRIVTYY